MEKKNLFKTIKKWVLTLFIIGVIVTLFRSSMNWCEYTELFQLDSVIVSGNSILPKSKIIETAKIEMGKDLKDINLIPIRDQLEQLPYIKAVIVSKHFPNRLQIAIKERIPVCYINHKDLYLIDNEGIILPRPENFVTATLPVISGFNNDSLNYIYGNIVPNENLFEIVKLITKTNIKAPELYATISEIQFRPSKKDYIIYNINNGVPVFLGQDNLKQKMDRLAHFQIMLHNKRRLCDYKYIDLRWKSQIIAKEKRS